MALIHCHRHQKHWKFIAVLVLKSVSMNESLSCGLYSSTLESRNQLYVG